MQTQIAARNVCVIGAGTMGSGIAAHLANLGFSVTLLDATQSSAVELFERAKSARPPHFYTPERANDVRLGNTHEHLDWLADADWVIEAIVENPDAKRKLYAQIDGIVRPDAMISTNTSGLEISMLAEGRSESFRRRFVGTHFFNPPRYLKLLELIPTAETDPAIVEGMTTFLEEAVARRVVLAKDTPGFIANRYGMWCMFHAVHVAEKLRLSIEEVDAITGPFLGRPRSGSFRLNDVVGLDVMRDIAANLISRCPEDPFIATLQQPTSLNTLLSRNWIGEKVGQGYYRREGGEFLALDLTTFAYRVRRDADFPSLTELGKLPLATRLQRALELRDPVGEFLRMYLLPALRYADYLKESISHRRLDFDRVMEWGFGWEMGPFALIDAIGSEIVGLGARPKNYADDQQLTFAGDYEAIPHPEEYRPLRSYPIIGKGETFLLRDLGDGVTAIGMTSKMGVISPKVVEELEQLLGSSKSSRFVLAGEDRAFSAGFDLKFFLGAIHAQQWDQIDLALQHLQRLGAFLERRSVVAAVHGYCLGAGLELALSCSHIAALAESQIGLPEARVGLLPGGRGTALVRVNNQYSAKRLAEVATTLAAGVVAPSADHARTLGYLRPTDVTVYHPDRLIYDAKQLALTASPSARANWASTAGPLAGMIDRNLEEAKRRGDISEYDASIGQKIKQVFARSKDFDDALLHERSEFRELCESALTVARIKHMVETNKPLRN